MTTINLTVNGNGASDMANHLRAMAEHIEAEGEAAIPPPGTEKPVLINDELVGAFTVPSRLSFEDGVKIAFTVNEEADRENVRFLDQTHEALQALVNALRAHDLPPAQYSGLLTAIEIVGAGLSGLSDSLRELLEKNANEI
ncbi:MAG: hypothetical protein ACQEXG_15935 [Pseudomonadota bacterium]